MCGWGSRAGAFPPPTGHAQAYARYVSPLIIVDSMIPHVTHPGYSWFEYALLQANIILPPTDDSELVLVQKNLLKDVCRGKFTTSLIMTYFSTLVTDCLEPDYSNRPTSQELITCVLVKSKKKTKLMESTSTSNTHNVYTVCTCELLSDAKPSHCDHNRTMYSILAVCSVFTYIIFTMYIVCTCVLVNCWVMRAIYTHTHCMYTAFLFFHIHNFHNVHCMCTQYVLVNCWVMRAIYTLWPCPCVVTILFFTYIIFTYIIYIIVITTLPLIFFPSFSHLHDTGYS